MLESQVETTRLVSDDQRAANKILSERLNRASRSLGGAAGGAARSGGGGGISAGVNVYGGTSSSLSSPGGGLPPSLLGSSSQAEMEISRLRAILIRMGVDPDLRN